MHRDSSFANRCLSVRWWTAVITCATFFLNVPAASAANRFWVGGTSDRFESTTNWAAVPRGAGGQTIPGASDVAYFTHSGGTIRIRSAVNLTGLVLKNTWTGSVLQGSGTISIGSSGFLVGSGRFIGGNARISNAGVYNQTGGIVTGLQNTFTNSGSFTVASVGGKRAGITLTGTLVLDGNAVQTYKVGNASSRVDAIIKNLTLENSGSAGSNLIYSTGSGMSLSGAITVTTGVLDLTKSSIAQPLVAEGGMAIASAALAGFQTANNATLSGSLTIGASASWTATGGTFTFNGDNPQTLTLNGGGRRFQALTFNNSGASGQKRIFIAGNGLFASGAVTITRGDLDLMTNSQVLVTDGGLTLTSDANASLKTRSNMFLSGSLTIGADAGWTATGGTLTFSGDNPQTATINGSNRNVYNLTINNTGASNTTNTVTFAGSAFRVLGDTTVTLGSMDLQTNSIALGIAGGLTVADSATARFLSNANLTMSGSLTKKPAGVLTLSSGTVSLNGSSQTLSGTMTLPTLYKVSSDALYFYPGYTYTLTGDFNIGGLSSSSKLTVNSSIAGQRHSLDIAGLKAIHFIAVKDSRSANGSIKCTDCTDNGNNVLWDFFSSTSGSSGTTSGSGGGGGGGGGRGSKHAADVSSVTSKKDEKKTVKKAKKTVKKAKKAAKKAVKKTVKKSRK
ncbi:MAG: hypothetical protein G01um101425_457 [Candidatus Peregrinibacteria bacterium Gr01-1014_25]|nr:MAG: hypothetical protein G01um101425_457 [Candidatus Peregrinibacteria bacterium Gr01-1014_25]